MRVRLPAVRWGDGDRRVLLVHGLTSSARVWWRVASELGDRGWSVTAVDLRGHGHAPPATHYGIEEIADDLLGHTGPWEMVVGHSIGGTAVLAAGQKAGWTGRMVLVDPLLSIDPLERFEGEVALLEELGASAEELTADHPDWHPDDIFWKVWSARQVSPWVVRRVLADNDALDVRPLLATVPVPTTILAADARFGGLVDVEDTLRRVSDNPRVRVDVLEGVGHSVFRERPEVVVSAIDG